MRKGNRKTMRKGRIIRGEGADEKGGEERRPCRKGKVKRSLADESSRVKGEGEGGEELKPLTLTNTNTPDQPNLTCACHRASACEYFS